MKKAFLSLIAFSFAMMANAFSGVAEINGIKYKIITKAQIAEIIDDNYSLTGCITIPATVEYEGVVCNVVIGRSAFSGVGGITAIKISDGVRIIGESAFGPCIFMKSIDIPNSVDSIGRSAFVNCHELTSVRLPSKLKYISAGLFQHCENLSSVNIPDDVLVIGSSAFWGCQALTSIKIPNSVTKIESGAFAACKGLKIIKLPKSIKILEADAFTSCSEITDVYCYAENVPQIPLFANPFANCDQQYITLHVPASSVEAYKNDKNWKKFKEIVPIE